MTGKRISLSLAVAALLMVGAGCTADQQVSTDTTSAPARQERPADMKAGAEANVKAEAKVAIPTTVDSSIDAIIKDGGAEVDAHKDLENDAADLDSDSASAKAFGTASYDTDTK
jgi:hypothetical protein